MNKSNYLQTPTRNISVNSQLSNTLPLNDVQIAEDLDTHMSIIKDALKKKQFKKAYKINHKFLQSLDKKLKLQQTNRKINNQSIHLRSVEQSEDSTDIFSQVKVQRLQVTILGHLQSRCLYSKTNKYSPSFKRQIFSEQLCCIKRLYKNLTIIFKKIRPKNAHFQAAAVHEEDDFRDFELLSTNSLEDHELNRQIQNLECQIKKGHSQ